MPQRCVPWICEVESQQYTQRLKLKLRRSLLMRNLKWSKIIFAYCKNSFVDGKGTRKLNAVPRNRLPWK